MEELKSLADLLDLQDVDLQIDRLLHRRQSLPELDGYREADARLQALTADRDAAAGVLRQTSLDSDKTSGELDIAEQRLATEENRLYAGGLSARDADYMRREVEMLRRKKSEMEDRLLELMDARDQQEAALRVLESAVEVVAAEKGGFEGAIAEAWREIDAELARREARKTDIVPLVDEGLLALYEDLRPLKDGGVAVARLVEGVCGACHLTLTAAERLEVKSTDPPRCLHCRCILVL
jgi:predicted  nucleic acid-binding Zn-ribbon protein